MDIIEFFAGNHRLGLTSNITEQMNELFGGSASCKQLFVDCDKYFKTPKRDGYHYNYNNMTWHVRRVIFACRDYPNDLTQKELANIKKDIGYLLEDITIFFSRKIECDDFSEKELMTFYKRLEEYLLNIYNLREFLEQKNVG